MSLVEKCWMVTAKMSVIAILMITGICFGKFVYPYIKKKKGAVAVSIVYIATMLVLYMIPQQIDDFFVYLIGVIAAFLVMYAEETYIRKSFFQLKFGKEHGIGLNNIRRVAGMYMGDISLEQRAGEVILSIMLQVE